MSDATPAHAGYRHYIYRAAIHYPATLLATCRKPIAIAPACPIKLKPPALASDYQHLLQFCLASSVPLYALLHKTQTEFRSFLQGLSGSEGVEEPGKEWETADSGRLQRGAPDAGPRDHSASGRLDLIAKVWANVIDVSSAFLAFLDVGRPKPQARVFTLTSAMMSVSWITVTSTQPQTVYVCLVLLCGRNLRLPFLSERLWGDIAELYTEIKNIHEPGEHAGQDTAGMYILSRTRLASVVELVRGGIAEDEFFQDAR
ncbi:hypothetical protein BJV77DRAFT_1083368 [Russula vinacea]|nr:hypothetical protein BJV77DRAFT_1083368 [Russula vinacea]